jgi:hypothetical protein
VRCVCRRDYFIDAAGGLVRTHRAPTTPPPNNKYVAGATKCTELAARESNNEESREQRCIPVSASTPLLHVPVRETSSIATLAMKRSCDPPEPSISQIKW